MMFVLIHCNVTGVTSAAVTPNPSGASKFTLEFSGVRVTQSLVFYIVFCRFFLLPFSVSSLHCLTFELRFLITPSNHFYYFMKCFRDRLSFCLFFFSSLYCLSSDCLFKQSVGFHVVLCRSLFFLLPFFVSLLYCLTFELRFLIIPSNNL
jgi:hypothetical protein